MGHPLHKIGKLSLLFLLVSVLVYVQGKWFSPGCSQEDSFTAEQGEHSHDSPNGFWGINHRMTRFQLESSGYNLTLIPERDEPGIEGLSRESWNEIKRLSRYRKYEVNNYHQDAYLPPPGSLEVSLRINQTHGEDHVVSITALYKPKAYEKIKAALDKHFGEIGSESSFEGIRLYSVKPPELERNGTPDPGGISLMRREDNRGPCILSIEFQNSYYR